jgi:hypothetical protein
MTDSKIEKIKRLIPKQITASQAKDTGMAMVLICLLVAFFGGVHVLYSVAIVLLLVDMIWPSLFKPVAKIWLGFSHILGSIMSKIILSIIFFLLVFPIGLLRQLIGKDSLQLKRWKNDHKSVFKVREHEFTADDIQHPY